MAAAVSAAVPSCLVFRYWGQWQAVASLQLCMVWQGRPGEYLSGLGGRSAVRYCRSSTPTKELPRREARCLALGVRRRVTIDP